MGYRNSTTVRYCWTTDSGWSLRPFGSAQGNVARPFLGVPAYGGALYWVMSLPWVQILAGIIILVIGGIILDSLLGGPKRRAPQSESKRETPRPEQRSHFLLPTSMCGINSSEA